MNSACFCKSAAKAMACLPPLINVLPFSMIKRKISYRHGNFKPPLGIFPTLINHWC